MDCAEYFKLSELCTSIAPRKKFKVLGLIKLINRKLYQLIFCALTCIDNES